MLHRGEIPFFLVRGHILFLKEPENESEGGSQGLSCSAFPNAKFRTSRFHCTTSILQTLIVTARNTCFLSVPWGSYFDYVFEWNKHADDENVMTVTYEELKAVRNERGWSFHCGLGRGFVKCSSLYYLPVHLGVHNVLIKGAILPSWSVDAGPAASTQECSAARPRWRCLGDAGAVCSVSVRAATLGTPSADRSWSVQGVFHATSAQGFAADGRWEWGLGVGWKFSRKAKS